jgi:hypothetical protein
MEFIHISFINKLNQMIQMRKCYDLSYCVQIFIYLLGDLTYTPRYAFYNITYYVFN